MHGLVRCKHERKCSHTLGADVSFRDVTIKIPDRGFEKSQLVEIEAWMRPDEFVRYGRRRWWGGGRADVSFRDVTIKIPDREYDLGCDWRHAPEALTEIWKKSVEIETWVRPDEFVRYGRRRWWGPDGNVSIERWYLSPYVEKPFNSKVIKSFVPELRSRKCFFVFRDSYVIYLCALWTFYVHFTYPYHGYGT